MTRRHFEMQVATRSDHLDWWKRKLSRMDERTFAMPKWGSHILDVLVASDSGRVEEANLRDLGTRLGVPLKFIPRAVASVVRLGIVTAHLHPAPMVVAIHPTRFARRKIGLGRPRRRISGTDRESLKAQSNCCCACCGKEFSPRDLVIDHLIPLSLLGADALENWVVMSKKCNAKKWDRWQPDELKRYQGEQVVGRVGVRFRDGAFWPVINGRVRCSRRPKVTGR